jgi:hypothetical protein
MSFRCRATSSRPRRWSRRTTSREPSCAAPIPRAHLAGIRRFVEAGFDHVYVHQVGPDQDGFFDFYAREILPDLASVAAAA